MLDPNVFRVADIIHRERLETARQRAAHRADRRTPLLRDRLRQALSQRLIAWGRRLQPDSPPITSRA
jgi:hypothetical protein